MYRWAPVNIARAMTEPAPLGLLKATGMQPETKRAEAAAFLGRRLPSVAQGADCDKSLLIDVHSLFIFVGMTLPFPKPLQPGQLLARGVCRHLLSYNFTTLEEFVPERGKRVDVMALGPKGEVWVVECKSSREDFRSDQKWEGYLEWCDRYFWAVDETFPQELLPDDAGVIVADAYSAEVIRMAPEDKLAAARRKKVTLKFARDVALRHQRLRDPKV